MSRLTTLDHVIKIGPNTGSEITFQTEIAQIAKRVGMPSTDVWSGRVQNDGDAALSVQIFDGNVAIGAVRIEDTPQDTDTVTISDGTISLDFEFDNDSSITGDVLVPIGATLSESAGNLLAAITSVRNVTNQAYGVFGVEIQDDPNRIGLVNEIPGTAGNVALVSSAPTRVSVSGMANGSGSGPLDLRLADGSTVTTLTVQPLASVDFGLELASTAGQFITVTASPKETARGSVSLAFRGGKLEEQLFLFTGFPVP